MSFIDPIPTEKEIRNYYNSYLDDKGYKYLNDALREYKIFNIWEERYGIIRKFLRNKNNPRFLEVGVGTGEWFEVLESKNITHNYGIEIAKDEYKLLQNKYGDKIRRETLVNYNNKTTFDVICLWDVLEHLPELDKNINKLRRMLNKNGILAFSVPNIDAISYILKKNKWKYFSPPEHIFYYSKKSIFTLAHKFNFKLLYFKTAIQLQAYLYDNDCDSKIGNIKIKIYKIKRKLEKILDILAFNRGDIITFVLQKNNYQKNHGLKLIL